MKGLRRDTGIVQVRSRDRHVVVVAAAAAAAAAVVVVLVVVVVVVVIGNICIALISRLLKVTALYNILRHFIFNVT